MEDQPILNDKYELILGYEEHFAYRLGREVIDKPEATVWMILIPILFVHHAYRIKKYKAGVRSFAQGILDPRQKALDTALEEIRRGEKDKELPESAYFPDLEEIGNFDSSLLSRQLKVINIFKSHYRRLLSAEGGDYPGLLKQAYPRAGGYREFVHSLNAAEKDLNQYLAENIHTSEQGKMIVHRMQKSCVDLREEEIRFFYSKNKSVRD